MENEKMKTKKQVINYQYLDNYGIGFQELYDFVVNKNNCILCGACASLCPRIGIKEKEPILLEYDPECSMCFSYCARTFFPEEIFEKEIFGRQVGKNYFLGFYKKVIAAKGTDDSVIEVAQNGGVVSSLLIHALKTGLVDGILLTDKDEKWFPKPVIARTSDEILACAGSKYTIAPTLLTYGDAIREYKLEKLAFVGLPCQIHAVRKLQLYPPLSEKFGKFKLIIGLYCLSNFSYDSLKNMIQEKFRISISDVRKFDISNGTFIVYTNDGMINELPIKETKAYKWPSCQYCKDYTAELADISVGNVGAPANDWSSIIIRTDIGLQLFKDAIKSKKLITSNKIDIARIKKDSMRKKSQITRVDEKIMSAMQLLSVSDFEAKTYAILISLRYANVSMLQKVMKAEKQDIINALNILKQREWVVANNEIYSSVNPARVIKSEISKLRKNFEKKINTLKSEVLMNLGTLFVQNNFKNIGYKEFMDLI